MKETIRFITTIIVLTGPTLVLLYDLLIFIRYGHEVTITNVIRTWAEESSWPEFVFLIGVALLYLHLFRKWPTL